MISREAIVAFADRIREEFDPEKVILFGSYAYGEPDEGSDVDVVVCLPFEGRPLDKVVEILVSTRGDFPVDLLVRRPGELERRAAIGDPFARKLLEQGDVLYARAG